MREFDFNKRVEWLNAIIDNIPRMNKSTFLGKYYIQYNSLE